MIKKLNSLTWILLTIGILFLVGSGILNSAVVADVHIEKIQLENDKTTLSALLLYPRGASNYLRPAILAYHGWGGTKESILPSCLDYVKAGYVVLAPDLRGHGESEGISSLGLIEQADARVAIDYLYSRSELVNRSALSVLGSSFGGMISLLAAGNDPRINATVVSSAPGNTSAWLEERDFRWNERLTYRPYVINDPTNSTVIEERSPMTYIHNINNLLIFHGEQDALIPVHHAYDLYQAANASNKRLVILPNEGHNLDPERVKQETILFLDEVFTNPYTRVIGLSSSYYLLMLSWILLLIGGLSVTLGFLSIFPIMQEIVNARLNLTESEAFPVKDTIKLEGLLFLLVSFSILHIASTITSLLITTTYSTLIALAISTLTTAGLLVIGYNLIKRHKLSQHSSRTLKKWGIEIGLTLILVLGIYIALLLFGDFQFIPFINLESALRVSGILILITLVLSIESLFYWQIIYLYVKILYKNQHNAVYVLIMSLIYLITKSVIFFTLVICWNLLELRLIILSFVLFSLIGIISAIIRLKWGFLPTVVFTIIAGLTAFSTFSVFFFLM